MEDIDPQPNELQTTLNRKNLSNFEGNKISDFLKFPTKNNCKINKYHIELNYQKSTTIYIKEMLLKNKPFRRIPRFFGKSGHKREFLFKYYIEKK